MRACLGVLMRGTVALGPLVVPDATFGAILKGACLLLVGWIGMLVVICVPAYTYKARPPLLK